MPTKTLTLQFTKINDQLSDSRSYAPMHANNKFATISLEEQAKKQQKKKLNLTIVVKKLKGFFHFTSN